MTSRSRVIAKLCKSAIERHIGEEVVIVSVRYSAGLYVVRYVARGGVSVAHVSSDDLTVLNL